MLLPAAYRRRTTYRPLVTSWTVVGSEVWQHAPSSTDSSAVKGENKDRQLPVVCKSSFVSDVHSQTAVAALRAAAGTVVVAAAHTPVYHKALEVFFHQMMLC